MNDRISLVTLTDDEVKRREGIARSMNERLPQWVNVDMNPEGNFVIEVSAMTDENEVARLLKAIVAFGPITRAVD